MCPPVQSDPNSSDAQRVLLAVNPSAGARSRASVIEQLHRDLAKQGFLAEAVSDIDVLAAKAAELLAAGTLRGVVAAGGDGTIRLVADKTPPGTPLAILPLGTENLLARYLGLSADPGKLAQLIADGCQVQMDAGRAGGRLFTLMAGCGFDADVVRRLHSQRAGHIHHLSYAKPILDSIRNYEYPELRVRYAPAEGDGSQATELTEQITARWVFVVNLPRYAGGLSFAPQASGSDGLLDVCTFREGSLWHGLVYLSGVMFGQHQSMEHFVRVRTRKLRIESAQPAPYQLDGDPGGELPVEIGIEPGRLTLLVDRAWAERH
jgi:diacylglycerol kinase family enzyme